MIGVVGIGCEVPDGEAFAKKLGGFFITEARLLPMLPLEEKEDAERKQYDAELILAKLGRLPFDGSKLIGVVDVDLFIPDLNFIFGLANVRGRNCIISLKRLREEFYERPANEVLFRERLFKESIHELGHTFGLGHCDERCLMRFSNTVEEVDEKGTDL